MFMGQVAHIYASTHASAKHGHRRATECIGCGVCERACPQHIAIRSELARCVEALGIEG